MSFRIHGMHRGHGVKPIPATAQWQQLKVGAGGLITGIDIAPDGTIVCRADTYGGYIYEPSGINPGNAGGTGYWRQLITTAAISGLLTTTPHSEDGVTEVRIAPSNSNILYMAFFRRLWKSLDKGRTWTELTGFTPISDIVGNEGAQRTYQYKMAVDPVNTNHVIFSAKSSGAFRTTDGGTSWSSIAGLASNDGNLVTCVAFGIDPSGGTTQTIYVTISGTGLYKSTNGGTSFSAVASTPTGISDMKVSADGTLWVVDKFSTGKLWSYNGSAWTDRSAALPLGTNVETITCHPTLAARLVCFSYNNGGCYTTDTGSTWSAANATTPTMTATDCPWLAELYVTPGTLTNGMLATVWDPIDTTKLWTSTQQGVWTLAVPLTLSPTPITFTSVNSGIEQQVGVTVLAPPSGGRILHCAGDLGIIPRNTSNSLSTYPDHHAWYDQHFLNFGTGVDYAKTNPNYVAALVGWEGGGAADNSGFSSSGGTFGTWSQFTTEPTDSDNTYYGNIACQSATNIVRTQGNHFGGLWYTTNGGASSWTQVAITSPVNICGKCFGNTVDFYASGTTALTNIPDVTGLVADGWMEVNFTGPYQILSVVGSTVNLTAGLSGDVAIGSFYNSYTGWGSNPNSFARQNLCCDDAGTYYVTNYAPTGQGVYSSSNGSAWTRVSSTSFDVGTNSQLRAVPGHPGHLFFTSGSSGSGGDAAANWPHNVLFYYSTDGGVNWADVSNLSDSGGNQFTIREVWAFALGATGPGGTYPTIYIYGWLAAGSSPAAAGSQPGFYRSFNQGLTWQQFGVQHPIGWFDSPKNMSASISVYPLVFVTTHNSGFYYYG